MEGMRDSVGIGEYSGFAGHDQYGALNGIVREQL